MQVQLLMTGNEILSGDTIDTNAAFIAQQLKFLGLDVSRKITVGDNLGILVEEIKSISQQADILIINGGLGPTIDDLTAQALAKACDIELAWHKTALEHIENWCSSRNIKLNEQNKKQALLPSDCSVLANKTGSAVGFLVVLNNCQIFCTPGVPSELKYMVTDEILPLLKIQTGSSNKVEINRLQVFGLGEANLQQLISEKLADWPEEIELGFRASMPTIEVKLTSRSEAGHQLQALWQEKLASILGDHLIEKIDRTPRALSEVVIDLLKAHDARLTTAESCTGGLIASQITQISGSSQVFEAGFVTYSNEMKSSMINVSPDTLIEHGAVSEQVVKEMAAGALINSGADYVVAVSGVAGPTGGTPDKPVGTVWLAWGSQSNIKSHRFFIKRERKTFQQYVTAIALDLIRRELINSNENPAYVK